MRSAAWNELILPSSHTAGKRNTFMHNCTVSPGPLFTGHPPPPTSRPGPTGHNCCEGESAAKSFLVISLQRLELRGRGHASS